MTSKDAEESVNGQNTAGANPDDLRILEALLFASDELMTAARLKAILPNNPDARKIRAMVEKINVQLQKERHPFEVVEIGGGYQFRTITYYHPWVRQIFKEKAVKKLSIQALECLAIIAYKQPLSKAEIEAIRGVVSDGAMKTLLEKRLVTIAGRSDKPGRPLLYATTQSFLKYFGLNKIEDLPRIEEFESIAREKMEEMSLDELNEPESGGDGSETGGESGNEAQEAVENDTEAAGDTGTSVFEVTVEESEAGETIPEDTDNEMTDTNEVTDKTQAMVRDDIIPPIRKQENNLVKSADDLQDVDMGKTKAFSDSVFDLALPDIKKVAEEEPRVEEAETIVIKAVPDAGTEEPEDEEESIEVAEMAGQVEEKSTENEEEAFDLEELSSAIEEVKPEAETDFDESPEEVKDTAGAVEEVVPEPEESSFSIEVMVDETVQTAAEENNSDDEEASFEVKESADDGTGEEPDAGDGIRNNPTKKKKGKRK
ncbi:MAG: SMC-Scp complex subunit ScpB, partial [Candidatus Pacearchaeota archaeon]|nr:SMC-Scp complex subunit ScpB [Candidatus Pacearchaeota archaeon]